MKKMFCHPVTEDPVCGKAYGEWTEGWKTIPHFDNYEVNHMSVVRHKKNQRILCFSKSCRVHIHKNGVRYSKVAYHLALETFFPHIAREGRDVDHVDENNQNHHLNNLRWIEASANTVKSNMLRPRNSTRRQKSIIQYSADNIFIKKFPSIADAARQTKSHHSCISRCVNKLQQFTKGFRWEYAHDETQDDLPGEIWKWSPILQEDFGLPEKVWVSNMGRILSPFGKKTKGYKTGVYRKYSRIFVHKLVWALFGDDISTNEKLEILHDDNQPKDEEGCVSNAIEHLSLGTHSENMKKYALAKVKRALMA